MRTRKEIERDAYYNTGSPELVPNATLPDIGAAKLDAVLETLLDIRDLLAIAARSKVVIPSVHVDGNGEASRIMDDVMKFGEITSRIGKDGGTDDL